MTSHFLPASSERLLRAVLGLLACVLAAGQIAAAAPAMAGATDGGARAFVVRQAEASGEAENAPPALHADGAVLDLDDASSDGRPLASCEVTKGSAASVGLHTEADDAPRDIGASLPERPPRA